MKRLIGCLTGLALAFSVQAEIKPEQLTMEKLRPANPHRLYLTDLVLQHVIDGRVHVIDGDNYDYLGAIGTGMFGLTALNADSSEMLVATTYYTKRNRGKRFDQFEAYSTEDLELKMEIEIPPKHAQALPYKGTLASSLDNRWVFIQNATPASSITIVDRKAAKVTTEIDTPGCWISLPAESNTNRFSTLCGDGTILTITLDEQGKAATQDRSEKLFDAQDDALFVQAERIGDVYYFVSFLGNVHAINLGGKTAKTVATWSLLNDADKADNWRPGGYQLLAVNAKKKRLYVAMHDNGAEGSHKLPAKEIWVFDIETRKRLQRAPGGNGIAMTLTSEDEPLLYVYDGMTTEFHKYSTLPELKLIDTSPPFGEFAGVVESH